jgi:hypothetical protein
MLNRIVREKDKEPGDDGMKVLSKVMDTQTGYRFQIVRLDQENVALVFGVDDVVKIPIWKFFMIVKGTRDAEHALLNS